MPGAVLPEVTVEASSPSLIERFALNPDHAEAIMAVAVRGTTPAEWGAPEKLFEGNYFFVEGPEMFDVAADGRFLMLRIGDDQSKATPDTIAVVQNWIEELKRRVPIP